MDANWVSVIVAIVTAIVTGIVAYQAALRGTAVALATVIERNASLKEQVVYLTEVKDEHDEKLSDHDLRITLLERADRAPVDYVR